MVENDLMTLGEIADLLRCSVRHLQTLRKMTGFPRQIGLGKSLARYLRADIELFLMSKGLGVSE